jgi:hypothetical protein
MKKRSNDDGQILAMFAGGLVLILGIAALVVDLGFTFQLRRAEQNAADPGAIAAARYIRSGPGLTAEPTKMREAACFYAEQNGFFAGANGNVDACTPANDANGTTLTINYPPSFSAGEFAGNTGKVEVVLSRASPTFFARVLGTGTITVTSSAVAAFDNGPSNTSTLIALDPSNYCSSGKTHGSGNITIHPVVPGTLGGYVQVNSTCSTGAPGATCTSSGQGALDLSGTGATVTAPHISVSGTCKSSGTLVGPLTEGAVQIGDPLAALPPPNFGTPNPGADCGAGNGGLTTPGGAGCNFKGNNTVNLLPGVYYGGWSIQSKVKIILAPGIYVIAGGGISATGTNNTITDVQSSTGTYAPVMIFNTDDPVTHTGQAPISLLAQSTLKLHALDSGLYKGILMWNDGNGSNPTVQLTITGGTSVDLAGTIYNPKGLVKLDGGTSTGSTASVQIIAWHFDVGGGSTLDMPYDPNQIYQFSSKGLVR